MFGKEHMDVIHDIENQIDKLTAVGKRNGGRSTLSGSNINTRKTSNGVQSTI